jgi:hypothetical protein
MSDLGAIFETGGAAAVEFAAAKIAERGGRPGTCANCLEPLIGPYCAVCGQPRDIHRRSVRGLLKDFVQDIASFDSRILRTARALMVRPGELARAYHEGRTQPFVPPVRLYLFVSLLFFLLLSVTNIALIQFELHSSQAMVQIDKAGKPYAMVNGEKERLPGKYAHRTVTYNFSTQIDFFRKVGSIQTHIPAEARKRMLEKLNVSDRTEQSWVSLGINGALQKLMENPASLNEPITSWVPRALFLLLPMFALLLAAFYWRQRRDFFFVDHLVFSLSFHSFAFALLALAAVAAQFLSQNIVNWAVVAILPIYLLLAMRRMYHQSWGWTIAKFGTIYTIYWIFFCFRHSASSCRWPSSASKARI